jgi:hypothetical protein
MVTAFWRHCRRTPERLCIEACSPRACARRRAQTHPCCAPGRRGLSPATNHHRARWVESRGAGTLQSSSSARAHMTTVLRIRCRGRGRESCSHVGGFPNHDSCIGEGTCNDQHRGPLTRHQDSLMAPPRPTRFGCKSITGCRHIPPVPERPEDSYVRLCCTRDRWSAWTALSCW